MDRSRVLTLSTFLTLMVLVCPGRADIKDCASVGSEGERERGYNLGYLEPSCCNIHLSFMFSLPPQTVPEHLPCARLWEHTSILPSGRRCSSYEGGQSKTRTGKGQCLHAVPCRAYGRQKSPNRSHNYGTSWEGALQATEWSQCQGLGMRACWGHLTISQEALGLMQGEGGAGEGTERREVREPMMGTVPSDN